MGDTKSGRHVEHMKDCVVLGVETGMQPWGEGGSQYQADWPCRSALGRGKWNWHMKSTETRRNRTEKQRDSLGNVKQDTRGDGEMAEE